MSIFDAIIIIIIMILGIKGFFNGFIKEIAGFIGIVGGLYLASIFYHQVGVFINDNLMVIKNHSAIDLVGFVEVFFGFWVVCLFIGFLLSKILKIAALGIFDRLLGLIFSAGKFFIIVSVILTLLYQVEFFKEKFENIYKNSKLAPIMLQIGEKIINLNPKELEKKFKNVKIPNINLKGD